MHGFFPPYISNKRVDLDIVEDELTRFKAKSLWMSSYPTLPWWESNQHLYPLLNKHLLCIPATTVPRDVVTAQRVCVLPINVFICILVDGWPQSPGVCPEPHQWDAWALGRPGRNSSDQWQPHRTPVSAGSRGSWWTAGRVCRQVEVSGSAWTCQLK